MRQRPQEWRPQLEELLLGNRRLDHLFDLTKFCNLRRILLYGNELHEIDFAAVPARVEEMDLTNNRLERAVVSGKPDLRALQLSKNRLKEVRVEGALQDLDVSSNPLALLEIAACVPRRAEEGEMQARFSISAASAARICCFRDWDLDPRVRPFYLQNKWIPLTLVVLYRLPRERLREA